MTPDLADAEAVRALAQALPIPLPQARLVWSAAVDIAPRETLGPSPLGERFIVPIVGGCFWGGPGHEDLHGRVRPGGVDRQLLRSDGIKQLRAEYELQTHDGVVITVDNRVIIDESLQPERYAASHVALTAPAGPLDWLNRRLFVGSLQSLRPDRQAVLVRVYVLGA